jgi:rhodanese-related sulfurtransferase
MHMRRWVSTYISGTALLGQIDRGSLPAILDVRSRWEFARGHVPGARHFPFWTLPFRYGELLSQRKDTIVVYCGHGPRAAIATAFLRVFGFRRIVLIDGHMRKWQRAGLRQEIGT